MKIDWNGPEASGHEHDEAFAADGTVAAMLRALTAPEPSAGLETRVLQALEARKISQSEPMRRTYWLFVPGGVAVAAALLFGMHLLRQPHATGKGLAALGAAGEPPLPAPSVGLRADAARGIPRSATRKEGTHSARVAIVRVPTPASAWPPLPQAFPAERLQAVPAPAVAGLENMPAPPLPLTGQERLLLRYIHRRDPKELATLSPAGSTLHEQAERTAFDQFFAEPAPPPPPPDTPTGDPEWLPAIR